MFSLATKGAGFDSKIILESKCCLHARHLKQEHVKPFKNKNMSSHLKTSSMLQVEIALACNHVGVLHPVRRIGGVPK